MKTTFLLIFLGAYGFSSAQEETFPLPKITSMDSVVEKTTIEFYDSGPEAEFPGGRKAMMKFLADNLHYPERALKDSIQGKCWTRFIVTSEGKISNVKITRGVPDCPECDTEVIRVLQAMPRWIPAKIEGKPVNSYFDLPFNFRLN